MKIAVYNFHSMCEHNTLFLSRARRYFELNRHRVTDGRTDADGDADLLFIGGCAVTDAMRTRCEEKVRAVMAAHKQSQVVIFGCLAAFPDGFRSIPGEEGCVSYIPFRESGRLDDLIGAEIAFDEVIVNHLQGHVPYQPRMGPDDSYVLIAQGCSNACSYCTIKKAKGAIMSRPEEAIEEEVRRLYSGGIERVTLLADDCGSYGHDLGSDLPSLLRRLTRAVPEMNFKVYTLFPGLFLQQARQLEPFFAAGRISYLCLPVQSASPAVLELMNRPYDPGKLARAIEKLRSLDPHLFLYSHFIYNFPTETWEEFEESIAFARHFDNSVFIGYGENRGTRAAGFHPKCDEHDLEQKTRRLEELVAQGRLAAFVVPQT